MSSPSVKVFESGLDEVWKKQPVQFDYEEELSSTALRPEVPMMMIVSDGTN